MVSYIITVTLYYVTVKVKMKQYLFHLSTAIGSGPEHLLLGLRSLGGIQSYHLQERQLKTYKVTT